MDQLTADNSTIVEAIDLPNKTGGYQRQAGAVLEGTTVNPSATTGLFPNPSTSTTSATAIASRARTVQLFSKAMGYQGGNNITAALKAPVDAAGAPVANAPLSITVTDGTWDGGRPGRHRRFRWLQPHPGPGQGHHGQPGDERDRRGHHDRQAGHRRDQRRRGRERARDGVLVRQQRG